MKKILLSFPLFFILCLSSAYAEPQLVQQVQVIQFVKEAVCYVLQHGQKQAIAEFNNPHGKFSRGDLYIFAYYYQGPKKGYCLAHGFKSAFVGKNLYDYTSPITNTKIIQQEIEQAKAGQGGWTTLYFEDPLTRKLTLKHNYILPIPGEDFFVGAGYYVKRKAFRQKEKEAE